MDSSTHRRDRVVTYTLIGIFTTSLMGLCMLLLAAGIHLSQNLSNTASIAGKPVRASQPPTLQTREAARQSPVQPATKREVPRVEPQPTSRSETLLGATPAAQTPPDQAPNPTPTSPAVPTTTEDDAKASQPTVVNADVQKDEPNSSAPSTRLAYQWSPKESFSYQFSGSAEIGSRTVSFNGRNTLSPTGRQPAASTIETPVENGTGSGFLVTADGILITCAHVIDGATSIEVVQGGDTHQAKVIAIDDNLDLAALQIQGESFPFLKIGDSDRVRLADEVRAVGFPLSDLLGESVKVTRGEVSGKGGPHGSTGLQIDASFNPGNSGGPVIDNSGHVIGVANALLAGLGISEVGFAIPAKEVANLARRHHLQIQFDSKPDVLPPPDLIAKVSPAVVLLKVTQGPGGIGSESATEVRFSNFWTESTQEKNSRQFGQMGRFQPPRHANFSGEAVFDSLGQATSLDKRSALPYLLGNSAEIGIERLPGNAPGRIAEQRVITIEINKDDNRPSRFDPFAGMPDRFRRPWMPSTPQRETPGESHTGTESSSVSVGARHGDIVDVTKNYELRIPSKSSGGPDMLRVVGSGTGRFNLKTGLMENFEYHAEVVISQDNITLKIPTELKYSLVSKAQIAEERVKSEAARAKAAVAKLAEREKKANAPGSIEFHPNQSADATKTNDQSTGTEFSIKTLPASSNLNQLLVSKDDRNANRSAADVEIANIDAQPTNDSGSIRQFRSGSWGYKGLTFTRDGVELITFGSDNLSFLNVQTGQSEVFKLDDNDVSSRTCVTVSPDGSRIAGGTQRGYVLIWKRESGKSPVPEHRFKIDKREVKAIAISTDNKHVLTAHSRGDAILWELASGKIIARYRDFYFGSTAAVCFSNNDEQALICDSQNAVLIDINTLKPIQKMELTRGSGQSVAITSDGKRISVGETYKMESWDTVTGQKLPACDGKQIQWSAAFSPNGKQLLTGSSGQITLWDVGTGQILKEMTMSDSGYVKYVAFSPDGVHCAAVGAPIGSLVEVFQLAKSVDEE